MEILFEFAETGEIQVTELNDELEAYRNIIDDFEIKFRLCKGMIAMFDNLRLLHGRTKFDPNTGFRHLQGCYIDHDVTEGKLRRLLKP